jgi:hypothetical protein
VRFLACVRFTGIRSGSAEILDEAVKTCYLSCGTLFFFFSVVRVVHENSAMTSVRVMGSGWNGRKQL